MCWRRSARTLMAILILLPLSCTRLTGPASFEEGGLLVESLPESSSVPADWGELISVTSYPGYAPETLLWFQDDAGTVRIVGFDRKRNRLSPVVSAISRSMGGV